MSDNNNAYSEESSKDPLFSGWFIASGVFLVLVLIGLGFLLWNPAASNNTAQPEQGISDTSTGQSEQPTPEVNTQPQENGSASACGLTGNDQTIPTSALVSVPIKVGNDLEVPSIDGLGPGILDPVSTCFAHTPGGAVLSAANFMIWFSSQQQLPTVITSLMADGTDKDRLLGQVESGWGGATTSPATISGYAYEDRGPDNALVVLAVSTSAFPGDLVAWPIPLTWEKGDWKVVAPATDSWGQRSISSLELEGFIPWGA